MTPAHLLAALARTAFFSLTLLLLAACDRSSESAADPADAASSGSAVASTSPAAARADSMPGMDHGAMSGMDHAGMAGMTGMAHDDNAHTSDPTASAEVTGRFGSGQPVTVVLHVRGSDGKPLAADGLQLVHTERLHVLAVDHSLTDYSHSHPAASATPGDWTFRFTPKHDRPYHLWLDVTPVGGKQAFVLVPVNSSAPDAVVIKRLAATTSIDGVEAMLLFDAPLVAGQAVLGHVRVQRGGKPFAGLEPVMGAYAHIVGIAEDFETIAHVHPLGVEPSASDDRGGPSIDFHLEPMKPGFLKLFAQIRVDGRDVFIPFGVDVAGPGTAAVPAASHH